MTARSVRQLLNLAIQDRPESAATIAEDISAATTAWSHTIRRTFHQVGLPGRRP